MKRKITYIIIFLLLFVSLGIIVSASLLSSDNEDITDNTKTLSFDNLLEETTEKFSYEYFTNLINDSIEQYESYDFIEIKENPWLWLFEYSKKNTATEISTVSINQPFDHSKARIITIDTTKNKMSMSSRDDYESYLNDVYRIILTKLYYSLSDVEPVLYWPLFDPQQNWIPGLSSTYAFDFDETKYNAQSFVDDLKKTMFETGKFSERGFCIKIDLDSHYIQDKTRNEWLYPTEEQQKILDSFNENK